MLNKSVLGKINGARNQENLFYHFMGLISQGKYSGAQ